MERATRSLLERQLREVKAEIFQITGRYGVSSVEEMEARYRDGALEEVASWRFTASGSPGVQTRSSSEAPWNRIMSLVNIQRLREIAELEFADIVVEALIPDVNELRVILTDGSFVDIWVSLKLAGRYSYHWERQAIDGTIYRHDNAPHKRWQSVTTFPKHFHDCSEAAVEESYISDEPPTALREFLTFVRAKLAEYQ